MASIATLLRWMSAALVAAIVLWLLGDVCLLVFAAALLASALAGASDAVARATKLPRAWSLTLVVVLLGAAALGLLWWRGMAMVTELGALQGQLGAELRAVQAWAQSTSWGRTAWHEIGSTLSSSEAGIAGALTGVATSTLGVMGTVLLILVTALYFAAAPALYRDGAVRLLPPHARGPGREVLDSIGTALRAWFAGQLLDMLVVAVLTGSGLALLGVPLAATLAAIAGLLNFVPFIGALAGAVPALLIAFGQGWHQALLVAILFLVVQTLEGNVIAPLIQRRTVHLPPALTILSQTVFGSLFGLMGVILATPLAAALVVAVQHAYIEDVLGEDAGLPAPQEEEGQRE